MPRNNKYPIDIAIDAGKDAFSKGADCFAPQSYRYCDVLMSAWLKGWKDAYKLTKAA